jgi:hypothetical protein
VEHRVSAGLVESGRLLAILSATLSRAVLLSKPYKSGSAASGVCRVPGKPEAAAAASDRFVQLVRVLHWADLPDNPHSGDLNQRTVTRPDNMRIRALGRLGKLVVADRQQPEPRPRMNCQRRAHLRTVCALTQKSAATLTTLSPATTRRAIMSRL